MVVIVVGGVLFLASMGLLVAYIYRVLTRDVTWPQDSEHPFPRAPESSDD